MHQRTNHQWRHTSVIKLKTPPFSVTQNARIIYNFYTWCRYLRDIISELSPMALFYDFKTFFAPQIAIGKWLFYSKSNDISTIEDKFKQDRFSTSFKNLWKNFLGVIPPDSTIMRMSTIIYSRVSRSFTARGFSSRDPTRV